jgi:hypothetical protein
MDLAGLTRLPNRTLSPAFSGRSAAPWRTQGGADLIIARGQPLPITRREKRGRHSVPGKDGGSGRDREDREAGGRFRQWRQERGLRHKAFWSPLQHRKVCISRRHCCRAWAEASVSQTSRVVVIGQLWQCGAHRYGRRTRLCLDWSALIKLLQGAIHCRNQRSTIARLPEPDFTARIQAAQPVVGARSLGATSRPTPGGGAV